MKRKEYKVKNKIIIIGIIISVIILIASSYFLIRDYIDYKRSKNSNNELINKVVIQNNEDLEEPSGYIKIDWDELNKINEDIIGWITIENTNINYPILKDSDRLYYLKHTFDKNYNRNGSIFTINENPFEDKETVIYGHNMRNGIMFSELNNYLEESFFIKHSNFMIYTKEENYSATVFSCYVMSEQDEENNIKSLDYFGKINYYQEQSKYKITDIGKIKKIVKLSTCSYAGNHTVPTDKRCFVVAKLEKIN